MAKTLIGTVASAKSDKTITVSVQTNKTHPLYRKRYMVSKNFMAHDEKNEAAEGDRVVIVETRPLSARKRFILKNIVEKAQIQHVEPEPIGEKVAEKKAETKEEATE